MLDCYFFMYLAILLTSLPLTGAAWTSVSTSTASAAAATSHGEPTASPAATSAATSESSVPVVALVEDVDHQLLGLLDVVGGSGDAKGLGVGSFGALLKSKFH